MNKTLPLLILLGTSLGLAQSDSAQVPLRHRFAPSIRAVAVEASTFWFYYKGFGGTVDIDLVEVPLTTFQGLGFRLNYQEYRKGAVFSFDRNIQQVSIGRSACLRGTLRMDDARSDAIIGVSQGDPQLGTMDAQLVFGVDMHAIVVKPFAAIFGRVMGSPNGIWIQFGVAVGYEN